MAERHGDRGAQARVARGAGARLLGVGADVGDPQRAAEGEDAAGQAAAGGEAQAARALGEGGDGGAGVGRHPRGRAAQRRPVALGQPDRAAGEAERLAERAQDAVEQALGTLGGGQVVGDRLLGEQQPVRLALGAAAARGVELAVQRLGDLARADRDGDPGLEALDHGGEVVAAHGARDRDERHVRVGEAHERQRLAGGHRALPRPEASPPPRPAPSPPNSTASQPRSSSAASRPSPPVVRRPCTDQPAASRASEIAAASGSGTSASRTRSERCGSMPLYRPERPRASVGGGVARTPSGVRPRDPRRPRARRPRSAPARAGRRSCAIRRRTASFSLSIVAAKRRMPAARAAPASSRASSVPSPRPWSGSPTTIANSAVPGASGSRTQRATPTSVSGSSARKAASARWLRPSISVR